MPSDNKTVYPDLDGEIRRFETEHTLSLRFPSEIEQRFESETGDSRARSLLILGVFSLSVFDIFIVCDYFMEPAHILRAIVTRFAVVTPLALLVAALLSNSRNPRVWEWGTSGMCVAAAAATLYLHYGVDPTLSVETLISVVLILLVANCLLRIHLGFAAATSALIFVLSMVFLGFDPGLALTGRLVCAVMLAWVTLLTLTANYTMWRERRFSYLLQLRGRVQRGMLAEANAELLALSSTDRLTGLPNRHAYDQRLAALWKTAVERREPISAVMVDVDHFKRVNDNFGHPYGDRVLQRVSSLLQQALRAEDDFVARFGGEEFVVLLPHAESESAYIVAERMRTLVQVAGSPAIQRDSPNPDGVWTTVSCGVATAFPAPELNSANLIIEADAALYRAKQEGRNRVCIAPAGAFGLSVASRHEVRQSQSGVHTVRSVPTAPSEPTRC